jgi:hypothetical protein
MSNVDRKRYLTATTLDQGLLDDCANNLENKLEMIVNIETPDGYIYASDRNKYVGETFYEALTNFPIINRTVGEWLAPDLQFSSVQLDLSNVDGRFNKYLPGGASFGGWIGKKVSVLIGVAESAGTYRTIFEGFITDVGGFKRSIASITIIARDKFDAINQSFPKTTMQKASFPKIEEKNVGKLLPIIYGSWLEDLDPDPAIVPTYCTNGNDPHVDFKERIFTVTISSPAIFECNEHNLEDGDKIQLTTSGALPTGLSTGTDYFVKNITANLTFEVSTSLGGSSVNTTGTQSGIHKFQAAPTATARNVKLLISENALKDLDETNIYLRKNDIYSLVPATEIENIAGDNRTFEIKQRTATTWVDDGEGGYIAYNFEQSDEFYVRVVGKDLLTYTDNIVSQAKDILKTFGGLVDGDFDSSWDSYRDKATPTESAISTMVSRVWIQEPQGAMQYVLSMLEQVRLESFVDVNLTLKLSSLHFDNFIYSPTHTIRNWDVEKGSFQTAIDDKNNFNRAQAVYNFSPIRNENARLTAIYRNSAAISQIGKEISKKIVFPNLYKQNTVIDQLVETLKIASATIEILGCNLTWRSLLRDIGGWVYLDVKIGSSEYDLVPCLIREIGYDPDGLKIPVKLWSFQMCPFSGYVPGYAGTVGGYNATITGE